MPSTETAFITFTVMSEPTSAVSVRSSRPEDSSVAGELIYSTSPYFFDHVFGSDRTKTCQLLKRLYQKGTGIFSHQFSTVAEHAGTVVGLVLGYNGWQRHYHSLLNDFYVLTRYSPKKVVWMLYRDFHVKKFIKRIPHGSYYIAHVAVLPAFQHHGVAHAMLTRVIEKAKASGYASCSLDASVENEVAIRLYQDMGFAIAKTIRNNVLEEKYQLQGQHRMIKRLSK